MDREEFDWGLFIEKHRLIIGAILLVLIIIGGGFLLWRENHWKPELEKRVEELEKKIVGLELEKNAVVAIVPKAEETKEPIAEVASTNKNSNVATNVTVTKPLEDIISVKVNINTATLSQLDSLSGIGPVIAQRIIDFRTSKGPFKSIEEIKKVQGIGDKTYEKFKDKITI
ncbi:MAG: helix-hairpin-helix domain-containing protein [Patescibacteria group bacterium]